MGDPVTLVFGVIVSGTPIVVGYLINRSIKGIDKSLASLAAKVEGLTSQDTKILIELAELRTRVLALEYVMRGNGK